MEKTDLIIEKYGITKRIGKPMQIPGMGRRKMYELFAELGLKHGCEVGVQRGRNAKVILDTIPDSSLFLVDPYRDHNFGYRTWSREDHIRFRKQTEKRLKDDNIVEYLWTFSEDALKDVADESLDFVYIDGDHSYDFVMLDIILWLRKVKVGGIISGHDYYYKSRRQANIPKVTSAVQHYTAINKIQYFITDKTSEEPGDAYPSWFWVKEREYKTNLERKNYSKGIVYYTDNTGDEKLMSQCREQIKRCAEINGIEEIICVSHKPVKDFGTNIVMNLERSVPSIFKQILTGVERSTADVIFLCEHDIVYHPDHFKFKVPEENTFYYDRNRWSVCDVTGKGVFYHTDCPSMMVAHRNILLKHYRLCCSQIEENGWRSRYGYAPPKGHPTKKVGYRVSFMSDNPSLDIRRKDGWTKKRMNKSQFSSDRACRGWKESGVIPSWGQTEGRFDEFIEHLNTC